jgi:hypothetical protein
MDDRNIVVPGARPIEDVLRSDPLYRLAGGALTTPWVLGLVLALLIVLIIVFGPSADSRFIYTDF